MDTVNWHCLAFESLSLHQWHNLLTLRINIFVVEQNCPYPELDGKDPLCHHVFGEINGEVVAVSRIVPPGLSYAEVAIGRVATAQNERGRGLGIELMNQSLNYITSLYGMVPVRISAQSYLERFYFDLGFVPTGKNYLEDGIPHLEMVKPK